MKRLMMTTAIAMGLSGAAFAQQAEPVAPAAPGAPMGAAQTQDRVQGMDATGVEAEAPMTTQAGDLQVPGFLASDFAGMSLHAFDPEGTEAYSADGANTTADPAARWNSGEAVLAVREDWDDIGTINDTVLTQDGEVRGVLIDIGGFLGMGAKTVMVDIADIYFVPDSETVEDLSDFYAVAGLSRAQLEALPEWSEDQLVAGYPWGDTPSTAMTGVASTDADAPLASHNMEEGAGMGAAGMTGMASTAPDNTISVRTADEPGAMPTAEEITGSAVMDSTGADIGDVQDVVLDGAQVSAVIVDVGGFLGIGARSVALPFEDLNIVRNVGAGTVDHIQSKLTREELEALPEHVR